MASTFSTNLKIELQSTGENSGTWGTVTNTNLGTALEQAIVGYGNPSYASDANLTLTYTDTNAAQTARALVLNVTSAVSLSATRELVVPTIQKQYIVQNNTTGSQSITVKTSGGTGITVPNGRKAHLYVDGTNVIYMDDYVDINGGAIDGTPIGANSASTGSFTTLATSSTVTVNGGTANQVQYLNASKQLVGSSALTFDGTTLATTTIDATNVEVTNIKAKDGTAAASIADSTGVISLTSNPTLSGGTANGVLYLNASKVATSGSALVFDGTNLGLGAAVQGSWGSGTTVFQLGRSTTDKGSISTEEISGDDYLSMLRYCYFDNTNWKRYGGGSPTRYYQRAGAHGWQTATSGTNDTTFTWTDVMTLDASGNLGIGTSSPAYNLSIVSSGATATLNLKDSGTADGGRIRIRSQSENLEIITGGGVTATFDSAQNLGLGVTPSAWSSTLIKAIQIGDNNGSISSYTTGNTNADWLFLNNNAYYDAGGWKYTASSTAAQYAITANEHRWYNAPSGTAGNTISFTQAMTLDASGNLGVGITSPAARLHVRETSSSTTVMAGIYVNNFSFDSNTQGGIGFFAADNYNAKIYTLRSGTSAGNLVFATNGGGGVSESNVTERARITSGGDFGIGTTSPGEKLQVAGNIKLTGTNITSAPSTTTQPAYFLSTNAGGNFFVGIDSSTGGSFGAGAYGRILYSSGAYPMVFYTNDTERARITSGGDLLVGETSNSSAGAIVSIKQSGTGNVEGLRVTSSGAYATTVSYNTAASYAGTLFYASASRAASSAFNLFQGIANGADQFYVRGDGVIYAQNTTIQSISDARLKENVRNASEGLNVISALRPVRYDWKEGFGNDRKDQLGFIAQEVEAVFPDAVSEWKAKEGEETYKTVGPAALIPVLVKAIQELKAELDAAKVKIAALETK